MNLPLVSSYVLVYKRYDHLFETLNSILNQDYPNIEIIVSDDGSGDFPYDKVANFIHNNNKGNIKNVIINVNIKNEGTVRHFNRVLKMCNGKYFIGVASDDSFINNSIISSLVKEFQKTKALIITARRQAYLSNGNTGIISPSVKQMNLINNLKPYELYVLMTGINIISSSCTYYSREVFEIYGYFDERYILLDDYPKYLSLLRQNVKVYVTNLITINYNYGGVSTRGHLHSQIYKDAILAIEVEIFPYIKKFNFFAKRRVLYQYNYFKKWENMKFIQKIIFKLKYIDAVLYRLRFL